LAMAERTAAGAGARHVPRSEKGIIVFAPTDRRHFLAALFPAIRPARQVDDFDADAVLHPSNPICGFSPNGLPQMTAIAVADQGFTQFWVWCGQEDSNFHGLPH